jgi:predicted ATPase
MSVDRITQLRISGLRTIGNVALDLRGLTVLIGNNGVGKSSILEALELLSLAAKPLRFVTDVIEGAHGGFRSLLRRGCSELALGVSIEGAGPKLDYDFALGLRGTSAVVVSERIDIHDGPNGSPRPVLVRSGAKTQIFDGAVEILFSLALQETFGEQVLALPWSGPRPQLLQRLIAALNAIDVHVPFDTRPLWQQREREIHRGPRWPSELAQGERLQRYGVNLPNVFQSLRNEGNGTWQRVIERAQLGLGEDLRDFKLTPFGRGSIELEVLFGRFPKEPLPAAMLSEGELSYLAFVALCELQEGRSVLAFDEPELHLHPALLARVVWMLEDASRTAPVILATHSDRLLDALNDPAGSVVLCELDETGSVQLRRPAQDRLEDWLRDYRGLGALRAEGYESHVFAAPRASTRGAGE